MRLRKSLFAVMASFVLATTGCDEDDSGNGGLAHRDDQFGDISFSGYVYDGVTGARLTDYELTLQYANTTREARVRDGRYVVTGLPEDQDFTINITAAGYRAFASHNAMYNFDPFDYEYVDGVKSYIFMAYLYPAATQAPATTVNVTIEDQQGPVASGTVRLRPTTQSSIINGDDTPGGIAGQVWSNDEDLLTATVSANITNGVASFTAGQLLYGVQYDIDVFGVTGYEVNESVTLVAGDDVLVDIQLDRVDNEGLRIIWHNANTLQPFAGPYQFVVVFNRPVTYNQDFLEGHYLNILDQATVITLENTDNDATVVVPRMYMGMETMNQSAERGLTITGYGTNTLTFTITRSSYFSTDDTMDRVTQVTFGDLDQLSLRPVGTTNTNDAVLLSNVPFLANYDIDATETLTYTDSL